MKANLVLSMTLSVLALGGSADAASAESRSTAQSELAAATALEATTLANADAHTEADARAKRAAIAQRGARISAKQRARAEARLGELAKRVDQAAARGEGEVASRLAAELGIAAEVLVAQHDDWKLGWGEMTIAHTLAASAGDEVGVEQLIEMHQEGIGWGQIAAGLGMSLGQVVSAVRSEALVASGQARADGSVAVIRGERGVSAATGTSAGASATRGAGAIGAGVNATSGASVAVPRIRIGR